ncbi:hypothetical protein ACJX0J_038718, partial [Zea mays]
CPKVAALVFRALIVESSMRADSSYIELQCFREKGNRQRGKETNRRALVPSHTQAKYTSTCHNDLVLDHRYIFSHIILLGPGAYGITAVIIGAIGYLFIRWKGWKLSDMMFVTKRGLSDACNVVGKQVDQVSESVNDAASLAVAIMKKGLRSRIFLGCDNKPLSRQEIMDAVNNSGKFDTKFGGFI